MTVVAFVVVAGCSAGQSGGGADSVSRPGATADGQASNSTLAAENAEPLFEPRDSTLRADGSERVRITFDGVTFEYDAASIDGVIPSRAETGDESAVPDAAAPADVRFAFSAGGLETSSLIISALSDRQGADYQDVSSARRAQVVDVESRLTAGADDVVVFVNGAGFLEADDVGISRFVGLTDDRRFLVAAEFDGAAGLDGAVLGDLVGSLFVDVGADALNVEACVDDAVLVDDVTVPEGAEIEPGVEFVKVWRYRNAGTCVWTDQYSLAFGGGVTLEVLDTAPVQVTEPGEDVDLTVRLRAPEEPGAYGAQWQLIGPNGLELVGPPAVLFINVP